MSSSSAEPASIVLFDGVCNLCNRSVTFIIQHDPNKRFRFASLQSPAGQQLLLQVSLPREAMTSVVLVEDGTSYDRSTAALRIARRLNRLWPLAYGLILVPKPIRDRAYNLVARNRYRLFGRRDACMLPTPELRERFLTEGSA